MYVFGNKFRLRTVLDNGSSIDILCYSACWKLNLKPKPFKRIITGIDESQQKVRKIINAEIANQQGTFSKKIEFAVLPKITINIPVSS